MASGHPIVAPHNNLKSDLSVAKRRQRKSDKSIKVIMIIYLYQKRILATIQLYTNNWLLSLSRNSFFFISFYSFECFSHQRQLMVSHWSLSDIKSPQVSRTLRNILIDLNNVVVSMVNTCPLIFKSSSPFINPSGIVPSAPITIGITVTFMLHGYSSSLTRSGYLSLFSLPGQKMCVRVICKRIVCR